MRRLEERQEGPRAAKVYRQGEIARYGRKSVKGDGDSGTKSIEDQDSTTLEMCEEWSLPTNMDDWYAEPVGYSGKSPYDGGGRHEVPEARKWDDKGRRRIRPQLTRLVKDVLAGEKRAVVVWSMCRLFRSVSLCESLIDLFIECDVELYDRHGRVDIETTEGRARVRTLAVQFENQRDSSRDGVRRGLRSNRKKGKISSNPNCLGIRTMGTRTNKVRFIDDEIQWVVTMMRLFTGDDPRGPASPARIGKILEGEGFSWPADLRRQRDGWSARFPEAINSWQVLRVLRDTRYVGYHPTANGVYQCDAFLRDGSPVVSVELFSRVQRRLESMKRVGNAAHTDRAFASILLCGYDAQAMQCQKLWAERRGGEREQYPVWRAVPRQAGWCRHSLPNIRDEVLVSYVIAELGPLLAAQAAQKALASNDVDAGRLEGLRRDLARLLHERDVELLDVVESTWKTDPDLGFRLRERLNLKISAVRKEIDRVTRARDEAQDLVPFIRALEEGSDDERSEAIRTLIRWAAVVPSNLPSEVSELTGETARNIDQGRVLFLTAFGVYHTAVIEFASHPKGYRKRTNSLRPAEPHESLDGVTGLPEPHSFISRLRDSWTRRGIDFDPIAEAPGYKALLSSSSAVTSSNTDVETNPGRLLGFE